ncbi:MAG: hypothetical protein JWO76_959 [Nocardioides sp.]|nr:hypothetical protein [Nocardioides sp.]
MARTVQWVLGALCALGLWLTTAPAIAAPAAEQVDWDNLPYFYSSDRGQFFYVPTNATTFTARPAYVSGSTGFDFDPRTPEQYDGKVLQGIWNKSCSNAAQKMTQSRTVYLPGAPGTLLVNLQVAVSDPASHKSRNPIAWAEVRINNTRVARVRRGDVPVNSWLRVDASDHANAVKTGANTITVVAQKTRTKKAWRFCSSTTDPGFGVAAEVYGLPSSDVRSSLPHVTFTGNVMDVDGTITNSGPSSVVGALGAQFSLTTYAETGADTTVLTLSIPGVTCHTSSTGEGYVAICPLPAMAAKDEVTVHVHIEYTGACPYRIPYSYRVFGRWNDPSLANNGEDDRAIVCTD